MSAFSPSEHIDTQTLRSKTRYTLGSRESQSSAAGSNAAGTVRIHTDSALVCSRHWTWRHFCKLDLFLSLWEYFCTVMLPWCRCLVLLCHITELFPYYLNTTGQTFEVIKISPKEIFYALRGCIYLNKNKYSKTMKYYSDWKIFFFPF